MACNRPISSTFTTPSSGSGSGSGSSTTNNLTAPVLVFSVDPDQGDAGDRGPSGIAGTSGTSGIATPYFSEWVQEDEAISLPGPTGAAGSPGSAGSIGPSGNIVFALPPDDPEESIAIPGSTGATGTTGAAGVPGTVAFVLGLDDPDEPIAIPGPQGSQGIAGNIGSQGIQGIGGVPGVDGLDGEDSIIIFQSTGGVGGGVSSVSGTDPIFSSGGINPVISLNFSLDGGTPDRNQVLDAHFNIAAADGGSP